MPGEHRISHLGPKNLSGQPGGPEHYLLNGRTKQIPYKWVKQITMLVHLFFKETDHNVGALVFLEKKRREKKPEGKRPAFFVFSHHDLEETNHEIARTDS